MAKEYSEGTKQFIAYQELIKKGPAIKITRENADLILSRFKGAFSPVYDKWVVEKGYFSHAMRLQIIKEIFEGMGIESLLSQDEYEIINRRAYRALLYAIISDINKEETGKKTFISYTAQLFDIELRQFYIKVNYPLPKTN